MTKLSASQAAKATGRSIPTITRAIKSGKLSGIRLDGGGYEIEAAELFRAFPAISKDSDESVSNSEYETLHDIKLLQMRIEFLEKRLADRERDLEKAELASERMHELYKDSVKLLESPRTKGWLAKLFRF